MKTKFSNYSLIAWAAGMLGFVSTFSQLFLVREFLSVFYGNELVIGIILFSWIFLSGLGSYLAIWFERRRSLVQWVGAGFMALAFAPMLSYVLLVWLFPLFLDQGELAGLADITALALLALLPVCLLNGILFSLFSQVFQKTDSISKNYSFESIGGLIGGVVIYFWSGNRFEATDALLILGSLTIVFGLVFAWLFGHLKRLIFGYLGAFAFLFALAQTQAGTLLEKNTYGSQLVVFQENGKSNQVIIGIVLAFLPYFIFRLDKIGKSVFIAGFSCLALEMVIMVIYPAVCGTIYRGSGIIISTFMAGMALGFWIKLPDYSKLPRWISNVLFVLAVLCLLPVGTIVLPEIFSGSHYLTASVLLAIGFVFSMFTGLLFAMGVAMGQGSIGELVAKTYGADMLGASLGALLVSSVLIPAIGVSGVGGLLFFILLFSAVIFKFSK